jgi:predicted metal-binding membrane protein
VAVEALVAAAWLTLLTVSSTGHDDWFSHEQLEAGPRGLYVLAPWAAMTIAMMVPSCLPIARYVAANTLAPRRCLWVFLSAYLIIWMGFLLLFALSDTAAHAIFGPGTIETHTIVAGCAFGFAAAWQVTKTKRRAVISCRNVPLLPGRGYSGPMVLGASQGVACLGSCAPMMLAVMADPYGQVTWMSGLAMLSWLEKAAGRRRQLARPSSVLLALVAIAYLIAGLRI